ncbi:MAG: hypothetical protein J3K34DRAFT_401787 [Monoraphidium minutum]|nr:MAG: hypothetical protein J3K34DRAFT_401787 [Monoraphidium minutum]
MPTSPTHGTMTHTVSPAPPLASASDTGATKRRTPKRTSAQSITTIATQTSSSTRQSARRLVTLSRTPTTTSAASSPRRSGGGRGRGGGRCWARRAGRGDNGAGDSVRRTCTRFFLPAAARRAPRLQVSGWNDPYARPPLSSPSVFSPAPAARGRTRRRAPRPRAPRAELAQRAPSEDHMRAAHARTGALVRGRRRLARSCAGRRLPPPPYPRWPVIPHRRRFPLR